jgi:hypothetical protein
MKNGQMIRRSTGGRTGEPTYPPLNALKRVAADVWIVDGPVIRFGMPWPRMPFPTRMTIIRLAGRNLFIHSPTPLTSGLKREVEGIGAPRWIIGPNRIHYWWIPEWHAAFPDAEFFHRASRTLVLTDLIEAFEPQKLGRIMRWLTKLGGVQHPDGQMPRDMRLTYRKAKRKLRSAVETMIGWNPERVILAHGHWYRTNGAAELQRAFRWLLDE